MQVNETKTKKNEEDDLQERENLTGKNQFLSWVGANDCVKDKVTGNYVIQMMTVDAMETKPSQPKVNHYKCIKQKMKSTDAKRMEKKYSNIVKQNGTMKRTQKRS